MAVMCSVNNGGIGCLANCQAKSVGRRSDGFPTGEAPSLSIPASKLTAARGYRQAGRQAAVGAPRKPNC